MQTRISEVTATATSLREAVDRVLADEKVRTLCQTIIAEATITAWAARRNREIDEVLAL